MKRLGVSRVGGVGRVLGVGVALAATKNSSENKASVIKNSIENKASAVLKYQQRK